MSINAIEVLEARLANSEGFVGRGQLHGTELKLESRFDEPRTFPLPTPRPEHIYHSSAWWNDQWEKHLAWRDRVYPCAVVMGYEVTPASGVKAE